MKVIRIIEADVDHCYQCPYYWVERDMGWSRGNCNHPKFEAHPQFYCGWLLNHEGRGIDKNCPFLKENE